MTNEDLVPVLNSAFFSVLQRLLDWESQGMSTEVVVGSKDIFSSSKDRMGKRGRVHIDRKLTLAKWDSYTLGVWTTASGSLAEVESALNTIMINQSLLIDLIIENGHYHTVDEILIHEITPGITSLPPPGVEISQQDSASIALIIVWTLVVFFVVLFCISFLKSPCRESKKNDPFTYRAPSESIFGKISNRSTGIGKRSFGPINEMELSSSSISTKNHGISVDSPFHHDNAY